MDELSLVSMKPISALNWWSFIAGATSRLQSNLSHNIMSWYKSDALELIGCKIAISSLSVSTLEYYVLT